MTGTPPAPAVPSSSPWPRPSRGRRWRAWGRRSISSATTTRRPRTTSAPTRPTGWNAGPWTPGRAARTLAWITGNVLGDWAVRSGWLARARTLLEEAGQDGPEHGWVQIIRAFSEPDARVRESVLREAIAIGRRFGDPDIEFLAHGLPGQPVRDDRPGRGGAGPLRRGAGGAVRRRADRAGHGRRGLLRALLGVRARQRRPPRRPVDAGGLRAHAAEQRRRRLLPRPLRRHPDRGRALAGGGDRAGRGRQPLRPWDAGAARGGADPPGRPARPARSPGGGRPAAGRAGAASGRRPHPRRPPAGPRRGGAGPGPARAGHRRARTSEVPTAGESTMVGPAARPPGRRPPRSGEPRRRPAGRPAPWPPRRGAARSLSEGGGRPRRGPGVRGQRAGGRACLPARGPGGVRAGAVADGGGQDPP